MQCIVPKIVFFLFNRCDMYSHWRLPVEQGTERNETWRQSPKIPMIMFTGFIISVHCSSSLSVSSVCIIYLKYIKILTRSLKLGGDFKLILLSFVDIFSFSTSTWLVFAYMYKKSHFETKNAGKAHLTLESFVKYQPVNEFAAPPPHSWRPFHSHPSPSNLSFSGNGWEAITFKILCRTKALGPFLS